MKKKFVFAPGKPFYDWNHAADVREIFLGFS